MNILKSLQNLVFPTVCAGCGQWDQPVCSRCQRCFSAPLRGADPAPVGQIPAWFLCPYQGPARNLVLAAKHSPRLQLDHFFEAAGYHAGQEWLCRQGLVADVKSARKPVSWSKLPAEMWVIPAPSHRRAFHRPNGVATVFAAGICRALIEAPGVQKCAAGQLIEMKPSASSQAGKGREQRLVGRHRQMRQSLDDLTMLHSAGIILVDDVSTTGATLREMVRVLRPYETNICAIVTFAQAQRAKTLKSNR